MRNETESFYPLKQKVVLSKRYSQELTLINLILANYLNLLAFTNCLNLLTLINCLNMLLLLFFFKFSYKYQAV